MSDHGPALRVLIADDQALVRHGLRLILESSGIEVVAEAVDGLEAVELARLHRPDVCLVDVRMPHRNGVEVARLLAGPDQPTPIPVVIVTTFDDETYVRDAIRFGASGFLLKDAGPAMLIEAVHAAVRGDVLISPAVTVRLLESLGSRHHAEPPRQPIDPLTDREEEVLRLVAVGRSNQEIAEALFLSVATVKTHLHHLSNKLGARNRVELAAWAWETGRMRSG